jgi:subfamily B ATP-binding cassette protein HlyB/CyaB
MYQTCPVAFLLAKLLQGFYQPSEDNIKIDDLDIRHLSEIELRIRFCLVHQDTVLCFDTIYDNIIMANPQVSFENISQACRMAEIHDVIEQLPLGYQTPIDEHGAGLSGGQKQRIAIARALLKRPKRPNILNFDEATSNRDEKTANAFGETINALRGKVTIVLIAHRLPVALKGIESINPADKHAADHG